MCVICKSSVSYNIQVKDSFSYKTWPLSKRKKIESESGRSRKKKSEEREKTKEEREYRCGKCDKVFASVGEIKKHETVYHEKPHNPCLDCGESFSCKPSLNKRHAQVHTGERAFVCLVCGKGSQEPPGPTHQPGEVFMWCVSQGVQPALCLGRPLHHSPIWQKVFVPVLWPHFQDIQARCLSCTGCTSQGQFLCDVCAAQHMTSANLRTHLKKHRQAVELPYAFTCHICEESFRELRVYQHTSLWCIIQIWTKEEQTTVSMGQRKPKEKCHQRKDE